MCLTKEKYKDYIKYIYFQFIFIKKLKKLSKYSYGTKHFLINIQIVASLFSQSAKKFIVFHSLHRSSLLNLPQLLNILCLPLCYHLEQGSVIISLFTSVYHYTVSFWKTWPILIIVHLFNKYLLSVYYVPHTLWTLWIHQVTKWRPLESF